MEIDPTSAPAQEIAQLWEYLSDRLNRSFRRTVFQPRSAIGGNIRNRAFGRRTAESGVS
jgi:chromosome partitioning protein